MNVTVQLDAHDYVSLAQAYYRVIPVGRNVGRRRNLTFSLLTFAVVFVVLSLGGDDIPFAVRTVAAVCASLLYLALGPLTRPFTIRSTVRRVLGAGKNKDFLAPTLVSITAEGVDSTNEYRRSHTVWAAIEGVYQTDDHIFIALGTLQAFIVPKRCFSSTADAEAFFKTAHEYWKAGT
jgi:hypothetical protein